MLNKIIKLVNTLNERTNVLIRGTLNKDLESLKEEVLEKGIKTYREFEKYVLKEYGMDFWDVMNESKIFNDSIYDKGEKSVWLGNILAPTAPEIYKKFGHKIGVHFGEKYRNEFVVAEDDKGNEVLYITIKNNVSSSALRENLVHEIEHFLSFVGNRDFHFKTYTEPSALVIDDKTARQEVIKTRKDYKNSPLEKIANANTIKRLEAQKHFKNLREFWDKEILPNINNVKEALLSDVKPAILINPTLREIQKLLNKIQQEKRLSGDKKDDEEVRFVITHNDYYIADARYWVHNQILKEMNIKDNMDYIFGGIYSDGYLWYYKYRLFEFIKLKDPFKFSKSKEEVNKLFKTLDFYKVVEPIVTHMEYE